ncbi:hypothetical protein JB92DRAFT_32552 [Gautieria morchelliformis]|nr:hypothetical protein JB92DRAFT_32552 [Gautieria morchelliformis]
MGWLSPLSNTTLSTVDIPHFIVSVITTVPNKELFRVSQGDEHIQSSTTAQPTNLSELAGKTIAVDAYVRLDCVTYVCAAELVTGVPTTTYVDYAMHCV